jgi:hypothetical protein
MGAGASWGSVGGCDHLHALRNAQVGRDLNRQLAEILAVFFIAIADDLAT